MEEKWLLVGLHEMEGVGRKTIQRIRTSGYQLKDLLHFNSKDWMSVGLSSTKANKAASCFNETWIGQRKQLVQKSGVTVITYLDQDYPVLMKETADPAWVLYAMGDITLLHTLSIAMVGTRVPTAYGRKVAQMIAEGLCDAGITVVSGLARGIDSICHDAALRRGGSTIGVLGTAIDQIYPPENASLYADMTERGLIVSEYPSGTPSHPGLFPQRNRIIAGLTRGTVVVEADERSGSLITADAALEANRDVFAVPGPITSPKSRGALNLIKQGAKTVTDIHDIVEEYIEELRKVAVSSYNKERNQQLQGNPGDGKCDTVQEEQIILLLEQGTRTMDELLTATNWDFGLLHGVLLSLIIKKRVALLPGAQYKLI